MPTNPVCDSCGITPAPYEFIGTEASYDDYGRFEWQSKTHLCRDCAVDLKLIPPQRYCQVCDAEISAGRYCEQHQPYRVPGVEQGQEERA